MVFHLEKRKPKLCTLFARFTLSLCFLLK